MLVCHFTCAPQSKQSTAAVWLCPTETRPRQICYKWKIICACTWYL